jgi:short subunit dehydrogenase-like uncharacterized protein
MMPDKGSKTRLLLYGAYGYTGRLTAKLAAARKLDVVLAGRDKNRLAELGHRLSLQTRAVALDDAGELRAALSDIACVVHMAGPFAVTSAPMLDSCLATRTHYIDITGEIDVFEAMWSRRGEITGITAIPGAGFDVVPTDCLAAYVASRLEQPASLILALSGLESASQGTLRTAIRQISKPVLCRRAGAIVTLDETAPRWIDFGSGAEPCVPVSWGDIATAYRSTGIGNVTVYFRRTKLLHTADRIGKPFGPLLRSPVGQRALAAIVRRLPEGPSQAERAAHRAVIWAEAIDSSGRPFRARLITPDPYDFTANSALEIASRISSLPSPLGLVTPSEALGTDFVLSLPGCARMDVASSEDRKAGNDLSNR